MLANNELEIFVLQIENFNDESSASQLDYFAYFLSTKTLNFTAKEIEECFEALNIPKYSNISAYLSRNIGKKFLKNKKLLNYSLTKKFKDEFDIIFNATKKTPMPTDALFPKELLKDTRCYIEDIGFQALSCYDFGIYDACSVMLRKLIETLIIETFEKYNMADKIKDSEGNFMFLSNLILKFNIETAWNISRNAKDGLKKIKEKGDLSAHTRRYCAKKSDILELKDSYRICIQELINLIDYKNIKETKYDNKI